MDRKKIQEEISIIMKNPISFFISLLITSGIMWLVLDQYIYKTRIESYKAIIQVKDAQIEKLKNDKDTVYKHDTTEYPDTIIIPCKENVKRQSIIHKKLYKNQAEKSNIIIPQLNNRPAVNNVELIHIMTAEQNIEEIGDNLLSLPEKKTVAIFYKYDIDKETNDSRFHFWEIIKAFLANNHFDVKRDITSRCRQFQTGISIDTIGDTTIIYIGAKSY